MKLTEKVSGLIADLNFEEFDADVRDRVKYLLLDYLGVAIRGANSDSSVPIHRFLSSRQDHGKGVPVIATDLQVDAPFAALAIGTAAHSLELDDVVNAASLHPGVSVISAALAAGFEQGCTGQELIEGIVAGYELTVKLGIALDPAAHYARGFHPTATCGTLGAAAAAAKILRLDEKGICHALGIAGSQAAGSMEFLADGAFTKRFHAGWSAHSGIIAAMLACEGFTGPGSIIEGKFGFLHAYSPVSDEAKVLSGWGRPYEIMHTSIKPHACCRYKQGAIDCIIDIIKTNNLKPADIERVDVSILRAGAALVSEPRDLKLNPASVVDAQFSMPFGAAIAILNGNAFLDQYSMENVHSTEVRELMSRVYCRENQEIEREFPRKWPAEVTITTCSGESYQSKVEFPKGDPENPLTWEEIIDKFRKLAEEMFSEKRCSSIIEAVRSIEEESNLKNLFKHLAG